MQTSNKTALSRLFDLQSDQASPQVIDTAIRAAGQVSGTNMWVLIFAIVIASVGLNVNSPATIIGAMLISPLMGPIIGIGYGAGINDFALIRRSLRNLATFTTISLLASTLYFLVTPLQDAQSELLSRTTPNIWDVLIAFFGGAAGMVGLTRKEKSTTIPGVAIATALMPPLCTVGYGIATAQPHFILGALYLFAINGVFIALATLTVTRVLRLPIHTFADAAASARARLLIGIIVTATLVPSVFLAAKLVAEQVFRNEAERYIRQVAASEKSLVITSSDIQAGKKLISLYAIGTTAEDVSQKVLESKLREFKLEGAKLDLHLASTSQSPVPQKLDASPSLQRKLDQQVLQVRAMQERLERDRANEAEYVRLGREVQIQYPGITKISVARQIVSVDAKADATPGKEALVLVIESAKSLPRRDISRLESWLAVRLPQVNVTLVPVQSAHSR